MKAVAGLVALALVAPALSQSLPIIPGAETMSRGFDMVKGTQNGSSTDDVLLPVFEWHYTSGAEWQDPTDPSLKWAVPDELAPTNVDASTQLIDEGVMTSYKDWITTESKNFNVGVGVSIGSGTKALSLNAKYNHESYTYKEKMSSENVASGFSKHEWCLYKLESYPPQFLTLNPMFEKITASLPASISSGADQAKYNQVVQYWGTHFPFMANFGGHVHVNTFVNKTFFNTKSQSWVANQFALTFNYWMFNLNGGGGSNHSSIKIDKEFREASTTYIFFKGGDLLLQNNATVYEWSQTIPKDPLYLNVSMSDISTLVSDSSRAQNLQNTIRSYINTGEMPATDDSIDYAAFHAALYESIPEEERVDALKAAQRRSLRGAAAAKSA